MLKFNHQYLNSLLFIVPVLVLSCGNQQLQKINSPDQQITVNLNTDKGIHYTVLFKGDTIIRSSRISLELKEQGELKDFEVLANEQITVNESWEPIWGKRKIVTDNYNELKVQLREKNTDVLIDMYIRTYNDGVGLRYGFPEQENLKNFELVKEKTQFSFNQDHSIWRADYKTYKSSQEQEFLNTKLSDIAADQLIGMPLLVKESEKAYAVITEANLTDWAGAFLRTDTTPNTMVIDLAPMPDDLEVAVKSETPAISPWRVIMLADNPGKLIESDIIANLNDPATTENWSWITPGPSAWDWWWCNRYAPDAGFELGPNQETMKYFIDFASEMGWKYQIVDWQWYGEPFGPDGEANPDVDITTSIEGIDIEELVNYAKAKNIKLIVWLHWASLQKQMDEALALYEKWGVSGIKVDFMDRQDQEMVSFYHTVAKKAADHKLVVDFHGAYKPTGVSRTYPNLITREGVMGNEYNKWSNRVTPEHNVTLPFTRGLLGEMDYTPVAFRNVTAADFVTEDRTKDRSPMVQTTRCQQLAMSIVYESAFTVFCDSPENYRQGEGLDFLKNIPTTWDDTKVLNAAVGDYIVVARKSGDRWYVGGMTDASERELLIDFSFLEEGEYQASFYIDGDNANDDPMSVNIIHKSVSNQTALKIKMAKGGGFTAVLVKAQTDNIAEKL